jgi:hypothetical protein
MTYSSGGSLQTSTVVRPKLADGAALFVGLPPMELEDVSPQGLLVEPLLSLCLVLPLVSCQALRCLLLESRPHETSIKS